MLEEISVDIAIFSRELEEATGDQVHAFPFDPRLVRDIYSHSSAMRPSLRRRSRSYCCTVRGSWWLMGQTVTATSVSQVSSAEVLRIPPQPIGAFLLLQQQVVPHGCVIRLDVHR